MIEDEGITPTVEVASADESAAVDDDDDDDAPAATLTKAAPEAVACGGLQVDDAFSAASLQAVLVHIGALAIAIVGDRENQEGQVLSSAILLALHGSGGEADEIIVLAQIDAAHTVRRAPHGANIVFVEANRHPLMRSQEDDLFAVGNAGADQLIIFIDADGDDAARHYVGKILQRSLLDRSFAGGEEDELAFFFQVAHRQNGRTFSPGCRLSRLAMDLPLPAAPTSGISYTFSQYTRPVLVKQSRYAWVESTMS